MNNNILLINGPNLNLLGNREPDKYGSVTLNELIFDLDKQAKLININLFNVQFNSESKIIDSIQNSKKNNINFILINAGAFTHTSIAIRDALIAINIPFVEIHITNIYKREPFRKFSYLSDIADGIICGLGIHGYYFALQFAKNYLINNK